MIEQALQDLIDNLDALTRAIRPEKPQLVDELHKEIANKLLQFPKRSARLQKIEPMTTWPSWGTEHVMTCINRDCLTCRRLATVKHLYGA